jgi:hypothetical protein
MTKAEWLSHYQAMDFKRLLLLLDRDLIPSLATKPLTDILGHEASFPDPNKATYPGVYVGGFIIDDDGENRTLNKGETWRIANILTKPAAMNKVLSMYNQFPNQGTYVSAKFLGHGWRRTLQRQGLWVDLNEVADANGYGGRGKPSLQGLIVG